MIFDLSSYDKIPFFLRILTHCQDEHKLKLVLSCRHTMTKGPINLDFISKYHNLNLCSQLKIEKATCHEFTEPQQYDLISSNACNIRTLRLDTNSEFKLELPSFMSLTKLSIDFTNNDSSRSMIAKICENLSSLSGLRTLSIYCQLDEDGITFQNLWKRSTQLRKIKLMRIQNLSFELLFKHQKAVECVWLSKCLFKRREDLEKLYLHHSVTKIILWGCYYPASTKDDDNVCYSKDISTKKLRLCQMNCGKIFAPLYQVQYLKELRINEYSVEEDRFCDLFSVLKLLRVVIFCKCIEASGRFLEVLCSSNKRVEYLAIHYMPEFQSEFSSNICSLRYLKYLSFRATDSITPTSIAKILKCCRYIDILQIGCNKKFTSDFKNVLLEGSRPIRKLQLCRNKYWKDEDAKALIQVGVDVDLGCECYDSYPEDSDEETTEAD